VVEVIPRAHAHAWYLDVTRYLSLDQICRPNNIDKRSGCTGLILSCFEPGKFEFEFEFESAIVSRTDFIMFALGVHAMLTLKKLGIRGLRSS
jgi:hypothetical protein